MYYSAAEGHPDAVQALLAAEPAQGRKTLRKSGSGLPANAEDDAEITIVRCKNRWKSPTDGGWADFADIEYDDNDELLSEYEEEERGRVAAFRPGGPYALISTRFPFHKPLFTSQSGSGPTSRLPLLRKAPR